MIIAFDLDGTLYDGMQIAIDIHNEIRAELGYPILTVEQYKTHHQSQDWIRFVQNIGIKEEDAEHVVREFYKRFPHAPQAQLIPGAKEALELAEQRIGLDRIFMISNTPREVILKRFIRDGIIRYAPNIRTPYEGKAKELCELAGSERLLYVGDIISDAEECQEARRQGADVVFYAILHEYAQSPAERMKEFAQKNPEFVRTIEELAEIEKTLQEEKTNQET